MDLASNVTLVVVALIAAAGGLGTAWIGKKIGEVHVMVNSNLAQSRIDREVAVQELAAVNKANAERQNLRIEELLRLNGELHRQLEGGK